MVFNVSESKTFAFVNVSVGLDKWTITASFVELNNPRKKSALCVEMNIVENL